jgi:molybdopterin-binding protein
MRFSAINILRGTIIKVTKGPTSAHVRLDVNGMVVTASIPNKTVDDLGLKRGMAASAVIKASDVAVATS